MRSKRMDSRKQMESPSKVKAILAAAEFSGFVNAKIGARLKRVN